MTRNGEWLRKTYNLAGSPSTGTDKLRSTRVTCSSIAVAPRPISTCRFTLDTASGQTLPAGHSQSVFSVALSGVPRDLWERLNTDARFKIEGKACYCSVLEECWITDLTTPPKDVKSCPAVPQNERW